VNLASSATSRAGRELLSQAPFFGGMDALRLERVAAIGRIETFPADTRIYTVGDPVDDFYVLSEGTVRFTLGLGKRETSAGELIRPGQVFGWAALMESYARRIATAYCLTPCAVIALDGGRLRALMERDHTTGFLLMKQLAALLTSELTAFAAG